MGRRLSSPASILVAPDSFKGTQTAAAVAEAIARGLGGAGLEAERCPIADGGEGTVDAVVAAVEAELVPARVSGPLGVPVDARFALLDGGATALVESAEAAGLGLVDPARRDPERATTAGVGELIAAAATTGASRILLGVGGTATTDGGEGAVAAVRSAGGLGGAKLVVLCDVTIPFEQAARLFAPQKGATAEQAMRLEQRLVALAAGYPRDPTGVARSGAGGGLAGGLWAALGAELAPGAERILDLIDFDHRLQGCASVITGEGKLDDQTERGKAVSEVCRRARDTGRPVDAIVGRAELTGAAIARLGLRSVREASSPGQIEAAARELGDRLR